MIRAWLDTHWLRLTNRYVAYRRRRHQHQLDTYQRHLNKIRKDDPPT